VLTTWILIYHINPEGKINFIKSTWKYGKWNFKRKLVKYFKTAPRIYRISNKSQIIGRSMCGLSWGGEKE